MVTMITVDEIDRVDNNNNPEFPGHIEEAAVQINGIKEEEGIKIHIETTKIKFKGLDMNKRKTPTELRD